MKTTEETADFQAARNRYMYLTAVAASGIIVWEYEPATHRILMQAGNDYTMEICTKYGIPEIVEDGPRRLSAIVAENDREAFLEMYRKIDSGLPRASCEVGMQLGTSLYYWKIICTAACDETGRQFAVFCTGQDVTARYEAQERFRSAFEQVMAANSNAIGSFRHNLTTNWTDSGHGSFSESFGRAARGTVDRHIAALLTTMERESDRKEFLALFSRENLLQAFSRGQSHVEYEYPIILDNRRHWIRCTIHMLRNPSTGDVEAVSLASDVTETKRWEEIGKLIIQDAFDYVAVLYLNTCQFEFYSKKADILFPALHQRVPYQDCVRYVEQNFVDETERAQFAAASSLENITASLERTGSYEASYLRGSGSTVSRREIRCHWLDRNAGEALMMRTDVTAAYEQEQRQLRTVLEALKQAKKANAAKSEFLSRMSHDMRTPLNGIIGMTYLTQKKELPAEVHQNLDKIYSSSRFLLGLINDVLDMTKAESGKIELRPEPYPIGEFAQYIDAVIRPLCCERNQELITEYRMPEGCVPLVDKLRINQIVFNLLSNAVKYSPEGSRILYRDYTTLLPDGRLYDLIEVTDQGIGMSKDFQAVLFEPFMQENRIDNSEMRGSGLGLAITKKLVDAMNGSIEIDSQMGKGTTVRVGLSLDRAANAGRIAGAAQQSVCIMTKVEDQTTNKEVSAL